MDDGPMIGEMMKPLFYVEGFRTTFFCEPLRVLELLLENLVNPEVLLTDFLVGSMNGMDLIYAGRALHPGLRTVLCSGHINLDHLSRYSEPPDGFVSKPCLPATLVGKVRDILKT